MQELSYFHDVQFPAAISFGATGGPEWCNEIVMLTSGHETRNARFAYSRRRYDAGTGVRSLNDLYDVLSFFEARRGSLHAFRFRDPFDMKSCHPDGKFSALDQFLGTGDGKKNRFPLVKIYGEGKEAYVREISKPRNETLSIALDGMPVEKEDAYFEEKTKEIVFSSQVLPLFGQKITAGFEFDVPVRFDTDNLSASITTFKAGQIPSIPLVEVRL